MKKSWLAIILVSLFLVGCTKDDVDESSVEMEKPLEVTILTEENVSVHTNVALLAQVKYGNEYVNDADEVNFEVWESGLREEGETVAGSFTKDGIYSADYVFNHDGVYYMYAHTTAKGMHTMPKLKLIVGNPDMSKVLEDTSTNSMPHMNEESTEEENHGHK
jgi:hypothetical protein